MGRCLVTILIMLVQFLLLKMDYEVSFVFNEKIKNICIKITVTHRSMGTGHWALRNSFSHLLSPNQFPQSMNSAITSMLVIFLLVQCLFFIQINKWTVRQINLSLLWFKAKAFLHNIISMLGSHNISTTADSPLAGKLFVVIGAGGAGKALAYGAKEKGAQVVIANRTYGKLPAFDRFLQCSVWYTSFYYSCFLIIYFW